MVGGNHFISSVGEEGVASGSGPQLGLNLMRPVTFLSET